MSDNKPGLIFPVTHSIENRLDLYKALGEALRAEVPLPLSSIDDTVFIIGKNIVTLKLGTDKDQFADSPATQ